ncbi:hypothetical protein SAMN04488023_10392 [Pedobacter rhizosphaerae]|uniref:Uncharacterized protein n=1 Tax=Pedobacter rhizosphaerae TaxID=390241 RepID=A0A1H9KQ11_9SPHI|nr:hypothetical protein SAMN04488023_10392 [Pedobacter rhizosphaerae]
MFGGLVCTLASDPGHPTPDFFKYQVLRWAIRFFSNIKKLREVKTGIWNRCAAIVRDP